MDQLTRIFCIFALCCQIAISAMFFIGDIPKERVNMIGGAGWAISACFTISLLINTKKW